MNSGTGDGTVVQGASWDLASGYPAPDSAELEADLASLTALLDEIERHNAVLLPLLGTAGELSVEEAREGIEAARRVFVLSEKVGPLLRDTGRMTAEGLAARHLEVDLTRPDFWRGSAAMIESRIDRFEELVDQTTA